MVVVSGKEMSTAKVRRGTCCVSVGHAVLGIYRASIRTIVSADTPCSITSSPPQPLFSPSHNREPTP